MKLYINAMAEFQKEIERKLSGLTDQIITHMLYICLAPNSSTVSHWIDEVHAFIPSIEPLKGKNKFPKKKRIYDWTYGKKQDLVQRSGWLCVKIEDALDIENLEKENLEIDLTVYQVMDSLDCMCHDYFTWLASELSTVGAVSRRSVQKKIRELMTAYTKIR